MKNSKNQYSSEPASANPAEKIAAEFVLDMPKALSVTVAGNFNHWDARETPLRRNERGLWRVVVPLTPGRYEYRFVVDGQWYNDPKATESKPNPYGSENSVRVVEPPPVSHIAPIVSGNQSQVSSRRQLRA